MAEGAVRCELVSLSKPLIHRANTGNSPETGFRVGRILQPGPFLESYVACFPEFGNRETSGDEQGTPRRELRKLFVMAEK